MTSSLTTALEEMTINNEQLRRENDVLTTEIDMVKDEITQLKINDDKQKDEIRQLTALLNMMAVDNENQIQQVNSEVATIKLENKKLKEENQQLKVSQWSGSQAVHIHYPNHSDNNHLISLMTLIQYL